MGAPARSTSTATSARLRAQGFRRIAGIDEAGRGALAGPARRRGGDPARGVRPGRASTTPRRSRRPAARARLRAHRRGSRRLVGLQVHARRGSTTAGCTLEPRAAPPLHPRARRSPPTMCWPTGSPCGGSPSHPVDQEGRRVTASVAAASIVAKVTRDAIMDRYHRRYPAYGFDTNNGYGTPRTATRSCASGPRRSTGTRSWDRDRLLRQRGPGRSRRRATRSSTLTAARGEGDAREPRRRRPREVRERDGAGALPRVPRRPADVHPRRRDRAALLPRERGRGRAPKARAGWFEIVLTDAWVWDMYRSARFVSKVRVLTTRDVNVEELRQGGRHRRLAPVTRRVGGARYGRPMAALDRSARPGAGARARTRAAASTSGAASASSRATGAVRSARSI